MSERTIKPLMKYDRDKDYLEERVALEESIKIWQYICDHELKDKDLHPSIGIIEKYLSRCPLCERYYNNELNDRYQCAGCPLVFQSKKDNEFLTCYNSSIHPYRSYSKIFPDIIQRGANIMLRKMKLEYYRRYRETFNPYEDEKIL